MYDARMLRFAGTIFLSALLLFMVQPLIGRFILPWFGGGAGVWTVCLLFFQTALLIGYAYAHALVKWLPLRGQAITHLALLAGTLALLPIIPEAAWKPQPGDDPTWRILLLLAVCLGGPYIMLSSTGPLLQTWFSRTFAGVSPYRLYALSNFGSLLGLLGYPLLVDRWLGRQQQGMMWSWGYLAFVIICAASALPLLRRHVAAGDPARKKKAESRDESDQPTSALDRLLWVLLPACASILLLAITNQLTQEVAPMPFMWVLPLAVYLITFIIAFEWPRAYHRLVMIPAWLLCMTLVMVMMLEPDAPLIMQTLAYLGALLVCGLICHGELHRKRPAPRRLTSFYLAMAAGGALGGVFVSVIAPLIFNSYLELYIGLYGTLALLLACLFSDPTSMFHRGAQRLGWLVLISVSLLIGFGMSRTMNAADEKVVLRERNFYGSIKVRLVHGERKEAYLALAHGRINHGAQFLGTPRWPTMYYGPKTGIGVTILNFPKVEKRRIGVVGLGVGTLAAAATPGDFIKFYEINPQVIDVARNIFTYLSDTPATVEVALGDARLVMEREEPQQFDILALDAFSGDAIPTHLLTKEAFEVYRRHVTDDGVIALHITNRYLDLGAPVARLAREMGWSAVFVATVPVINDLTTATQWVLLTRNQRFLNDPEVRAAGPVLTSHDDVKLWTDDSSSLLDVMRWAQPREAQPVQ